MIKANNNANIEDVCHKNRCQDTYDKDNCRSIDHNLVLYTSLFEGLFTENIISNDFTQPNINSIVVGLAIVTQKIYKPVENPNLPGSLACLVFETCTITIQKKGNKTKQHIDCFPGTVLILGAEFRNEWTYNLPDNSLLFIEENYLPLLYLTSKGRLAYAKQVEKSLTNFRNLPEWNQCLQNRLNLTFLGKGSYANVYKTGYESRQFALKFAKLKPDALAEPYNKNYSSWHEVYYLQQIFRPLIEKNICPNLPLIYSAFTCKEFVLNLDGEDTKTPCVIIALELGKGSLRRYFDTEPLEDKYLENILFQLMAALHATQYYAQMMNYDIKKENIIYYKVIPGGYWCYIIKGKKYYIPNLGYMVVLNDYGIARPMDPKYPVFRSSKSRFYYLGSRYAIVKDDKFIPFNTVMKIDNNIELERADNILWTNNTTSLGAEYIMQKNGKILNLPNDMDDDMKLYLEKMGISSDPTSFKFYDPEIIPPFEFYNDLQDMIRIFTGGPRSTQEGDHRRYPGVSKRFIKRLQKYAGPSRSSDDQKFSSDPAQILASSFIKSYFKDKYTKKPKDKEIIATYTVSL